jgi:hypothetical protein
MTSLSAVAKLVLLQLAAFLAGVGILSTEHPDMLFFIVWPATVVVAVVLAVLGFRRLERKGLSVPAYVSAGVFPFMKWCVLWAVILLVLGGALHAHPLLLALGLAWVPKLALFGTCCQAFLGLGNFFTRITTLERVRQLLKQRKDYRVGGAARLDQLDRAERILGIELPQSYRDFLRRFGEIRGPDLRVLGISSLTDLDHPSVQDCVGATLEAREDFGLPPSYVLCAVDDAGQLVCIDSFAMRDHEGPVVAWNADERSYSAFLANRFDDFLVRRLEIPEKPRIK